MSERYDWIAISDRGVYALRDATSGDPVARDFTDEVLARGHRVECVPVAEAVERHLAYLALFPGFAKPIA